MNIKENRSLGMYILLSIVTCGIYSYIFIYEMARDTNILCEGDGKETPGLVKLILLSLVTCGIYVWIWYYNLGNRLAENAPRYGLQFQETGTTILLWQIFGILLCGIGPYIAINILIKNMNALAHEYNIGAMKNERDEQQSASSLYSVESTPELCEIPSTTAEPAPIPVTTAEPAPMPVTTAESSVSPIAPKVADVPPMGKVQCTKGAAVGQGFQLPQERKVVVGKNPQKANLVVNDQHISNIHCSIQYNPGNNTYSVIDHSTNGTFVNGIRMPKNVPTVYPAGTVLSLADGNNEITLG